MQHGEAAESNTYDKWLLLVVVVLVLPRCCCCVCRRLHALQQVSSAAAPAGSTLPQAYWPFASHWHMCGMMCLSSSPGWPNLAAKQEPQVHCQWPSDSDSESAAVGATSAEHTGRIQVRLAYAPHLAALSAPAGALFNAAARRQYDGSHWQLGMPRWTVGRLRAAATGLSIIIHGRETAMNSLSGCLTAAGIRCHPVTVETTSAPPAEDAGALRECRRGPRCRPRGPAVMVLCSTPGRCHGNFL